MNKFKCNVCGATCETIGSEVYCTCTYKRYVPGEGKRKFRFMMEQLDVETRSVAAYECVA